MCHAVVKPGVDSICSLAGNFAPTLTTQGCLRRWPLSAKTVEYMAPSMRTLVASWRSTMCAFKSLNSCVFPPAAHSQAASPCAAPSGGPASTHSQSVCFEVPVLHCYVLFDELAPKVDWNHIRPPALLGVGSEGMVSNSTAPTPLERSHSTRYVNGDSTC